MDSEIASKVVHDASAPASGDEGPQIKADGAAWALSALAAVDQQLPAHSPVAAKNRVGDRKLTAAVPVRLM